MNGKKRSWIYFHRRNWTHDINLEHIWVNTESNWIKIHLNISRKNFILKIIRNFFLIFLRNRKYSFPHHHFEDFFVFTEQRNLESKDYFYDDEILTSSYLSHITLKRQHTHKFLRKITSMFVFISEIKLLRFTISFLLNKRKIREESRFLSSLLSSQ